MPNPIQHEQGHGYGVVWCANCPPWRTLTAGRSDSLLRGADHLERVHGDTTRAKRLREQARKSDTPK